MERMTEEQAKALRWPEGVTLYQGAFDEMWKCTDAGTTEQAWSIALVGLAVANGHLPPSALDAIWDAVEGRYPAPQTSEPRPLDAERRALWAAYVAEWGVENVDQADRALAAFDARFGGGHGYLTDTLTHDELRDLAKAIFDDAANVTGYIPAPTWRPIAELPERHPEWMDGRWMVIGKKVHRAAYYACARYNPDNPGTGLRDDCGSPCPGYTHYLDLAIPEVPR